MNLEENSRKKDKKLVSGKSGFDFGFPCPSCETRLNLCIYIKMDPVYCELSTERPPISRVDCELERSDKGFRCQGACPICNREFYFVGYDSKDYIIISME